MFSIMGLFLVGDGNFAWEQLIKVISPSNPNMTMSPFVMTNSYLDNKERGFDGQSQNDWFTGSGTVFIKNIVRNCIGLYADMNGVFVQPAFHMPIDKFTAEVLVKGVRVKVKYENTGAAERTVLVDGKAVSTEFDALMNLNKAYISNEMFHEGMEIEIKD
jgi:cellobiose phosphorylase